MSHAVTREQLQAAREHALAGEYATASVYYEGVAAAITKCVAGAAQRLHLVQCEQPRAAALTARAARRRHVRELADPAAKRHWLRLRAAVADEADSVAALDAECAALRVGPAQPQRQQPEVRCSAESARRGMQRAPPRPRAATRDALWLSRRVAPLTRSLRRRCALAPPRTCRLRWYAAAALERERSARARGAAHSKTCAD